MKIVPNAFYNILAPDTLYLLIGPQRIFLNIDYKHRGPEKFIMTLVKVPVGGGPELHKHKYSTEMFFVVEGEFRVDLCEDYKDPNSFESVDLKPFDLIIIEKGYYRKFTNTSENGEEGIIIPLVLGTNDESKDIIFPMTTQEKILKDGRNSDRFLLFLGKLLGLNFD